MEGPRETAIVMPALMLPESHTGATAYSTAPMAQSQEQTKTDGTPGWTTSERTFGRVFRALLLAAAIVLLALGGAMDIFVCVFLGIIFLIAAVYTIIVPYVSDLWIDPAQQQGNFWRVLLSTIAVLLYIAQAIILDFFIDRFQSFHWSWIVFDVLVFIAVLVLAHGITGLRLLGNSTFLSMRQYLAGFCLAVYMALLLGKMCAIALNTPLNVEGFWSHTTFIVVLGACIPIYILLRWTLDRPNASGGGMFSEGPNPWQLCLEHIFLVINLVDTFAVLHFLPRANEPKDDDTDRFIVLTIVITCISHVTAVTIYYSPVVLYAQLHLKTSTSRLLTFFIRHGQFIMVDGLLLSLRLVVWFWQDWLVTAFIIKNVVFLFLGVSYEKAFRLGNSSNCEKNLRAADLHISQLTAEMQRLRMEMYRQQNVTHLYVTPPTNIMQQSPSQIYQVDGNGMVMGPRVTVNPASAAYLHQVPYVDGSTYGDAVGPSDEHAVPGTPLLIHTTTPINSPPPPGVYPLHHTPNSPKSA